MVNDRPAAMTARSRTAASPSPSTPSISTSTSRACASSPRGGQREAGRPHGPPPDGARAPRRPRPARPRRRRRARPGRRRARTACRRRRRARPAAPSRPAGTGSPVTSPPRSSAPVVACTTVCRAARRGPGRSPGASWRRRGAAGPRLHGRVRLRLGMHGPSLPRRPVPCPAMRLGVLDVGSNTVHLLVVDAQRGGQPDPVRSHKDELRLAELLRADGSLGPDGTARLVETVAQARGGGRGGGRRGPRRLRDLRRPRRHRQRRRARRRARPDAGVDLQVLPGEDEARLTFLAVRRWFGWSAGRLLCLDIGGGSLEIGSGLHEEPDVAVSVPLGAGRLTRDRLPGDPPAKRDVAAAREHVRAVAGRGRAAGARARAGPTAPSSPARPSARSPGSTARRRRARGRSSSAG